MSEPVTDNRPALQRCSSHPPRTPRCRMQQFFKKASSIVGDFGHSYIITSPPPSYKPGTVLNTNRRRHGLRDAWVSRRTSGHSDARSLKSGRGFPSSNRSWEVTSTFSSRRLRRWGDHPAPGGLLSNSVRYSSRRTGSRRATRIKNAPACFRKLTEGPLGLNYSR